MSASASQSASTLDPNDSRLTERLIPAEPELDNPIAAAVFAAGYPSRASRIEHCGEHKTQKCEDGHITRIHRFCGTRSCDGEGCAPKYAEELVKRYQIDGEHAIKNSRAGWYAPRFTFVDFRFACEASYQAISTQVTEVINRITSFEGLSRTDMKDQEAAIKKGRRKYPHTLWTYAAGLDDAGLLVLRVLFLDANINPDILKNEFGAVSADVHIVPMKSILRFLPLLFAVAIPSSLTLRIQMELSFIGIRRIRSVGQIEQPDMEELFVEEGDGKSFTDNSALADTEESVDTSEGKTRSTHPKHKLCPICNKKIVAESNWTSKYTPPQPLSRIILHDLSS